MKTKWCPMMIRQLTAGASAPEPKKSGRQRTTGLTVGQLVRRVESSPISLHDASRIRVALAGRPATEVLTRGVLEQLVVSTNIDRTELLQVLGLPTHEW